MGVIKELLIELNKMSVEELRTFREEYKAELEEQKIAPHLIEFNMAVIDTVLKRKVGASNVIV